MDLRRFRAPATDDASDPVLLEAVRREIGRDGAMTFARFMEIALYDPGRGYYRGAAPRPGRAGDFLTSPEAHPIFGRALAKLAAAVHAALGSPDELVIREHGAGTGALAEPLVTTLLEASGAGGPAARAIRYVVDEIEPARAEAVRSRLASVGTGTAGRVQVVVDDGRPIDGLAIANEVLDALPTHRVVQRGDELREVFVGMDSADALVDVEGRPSTDALAARIAREGIELRDGQRAEIALAVDGWVARAAAGLGNGVLLLIDYGHPAPDLYDPRRRPDGTLATYQRHLVGSEPYRAVGRQDITAHVDLTAVRAAASAAGLAPLGTTTQGPFLAALGAGDLLVAEQSRPGATLQGYLEARSAVVRMIDPAAMGSFRVVAFGAGSLRTAELPGFPPMAAPSGSPGVPSGRRP
jgi:SAM-dependent MidA family methyltransferase